MENVVENQTSIQDVSLKNKSGLCGISNDLDDEISHIKGLSDIIGCMGEENNEITSDAFFLVSNILCECYEKLEELSTNIMEISKSI